MMLETVHEFAHEKLKESAEAEEIKRLHGAYFLTLAEEAYPELRGPDQLGWLDRQVDLFATLPTHPNSREKTAHPLPARRSSRQLLRLEKWLSLAAFAP